MCEFSYNDAYSYPNPTETCKENRFLLFHDLGTKLIYIYFLDKSND